MMIKIKLNSWSQKCSVAEVFCSEGPESKYRIVMPFLFFCSKDVTVQHSKNRVQQDATECASNF